MQTEERLLGQGAELVERQTEGKLLEVRNISKTFDGVVRALDDVSIYVAPCEIVGVVGENGAGKSTLMKILVGVYRPDRGELYHNGVRIPFPRDPREAVHRGLSMVPQEKGVIPHLRVYQFLCLGHEGKFSRTFGLQQRKMKLYAKEILREFAISCNIMSFMHELPLSIQKLVQIARAILLVRLECGGNNVQPIIILDEPTAPLTVEQRSELFLFMLDAKKASSFIFVSHIIPEVTNFTDRVYVLRDGNVVAHHHLAREKVTEEDLFRAIVGRSSSEYLYRLQGGQREPGPVVLSVSNLTRDGAYHGINFELRKGECVGLFGAAGSGKSEILRTIAGLLNFDKGSLVVKGKQTKPDESPYTRLKRGIGYFSGETGKELFMTWPIAKNVSLLNIEKVIKSVLKIFKILSFSREKQIARKVVDKLKIKAPSVNTECYSLSGGNKQKVSVGKWLEKAPPILLLEDPTIGIDVGAREDMYEVLLEMKRSGMSMVLVSDDPKEYFILCDKVLMLRNGAIQKVCVIEEFKKTYDEPC